jgi:hypothetical protein
LLAFKLPLQRGGMPFFSRAWQTFTEHPMGDMMGFDIGAMKIGLRLRFGILDRLDVGLLRLNGTFYRFENGGRIMEVDHR